MTQPPEARGINRVGSFGADMPRAPDREPCRFCGVRADIGCRHSAASDQAVIADLRRAAAAFQLATIKTIIERG